MKKRVTKKINYQEIFIRYTILLALGLLSFYFYKLIQPITFYSTFGLLNLFYDVEIIENFIAVNQTYFIEIIPSCVAASAYLLLIALNLATPMNKKQRVYSLGFALFAFFILNLIRISILSVLFVEEYLMFDSIHKLSWYLLSTLFVVFIWFASVKITNVTSIPVYTDVKLLRKN